MKRGPVIYLLGVLASVISLIVPLSPAWAVALGSGDLVVVDCQANAIVDPLPNVKLTPLVFGSVRWPLGFQGRRAMQPKPGLALLPEPIALALDHEGVAVMQESIEDGGGDDVVAEDLTPLRHALIRRDQHRRFLVAMAHELKEEMSTLAFERHVAELVDDEQLRFAVEEHPTREDALALAVDEVGEERRRRGEEHGVASLDDGAAEGDRQVRLADAGRPEEERILGAGDEAAGGQLAHELGVDGGLKLEVEVLQGFHRREVRDLDPHLDPAALLGGHLIAQQLVEEIDVRRLHPRRFAQRRIEAIGERAEAQPLEMIDDTGVDELGTHPPTSATATA